jgi:hypothetical protein
VPIDVASAVAVPRVVVVVLSNSQLLHESLEVWLVRGLALLRRDLGGESHAGVTNDFVESVVPQFAADVNETHLETKTGNSSHRQVLRKIRKGDDVETAVEGQKVMKTGAVEALLPRKAINLERNDGIM